MKLYFNAFDREWFQNGRPFEKTTISIEKWHGTIYLTFKKFDKDNIIRFHFMIFSTPDFLENHFLAQKVQNKRNFQYAEYLKYFNGDIIILAIRGNIKLRVFEN